MKEYPENLTHRAHGVIEIPTARVGPSSIICSSWLKIYCSLPLFCISQDAVLPDGDRALVVLVGRVDAAPVVLIGGEAAQHEVAQVMFGDDPRGPMSIQGH